MPSLADRLRRRTTSGAYIPEIDGLRFVCIALVVLYHIGAQMEVKLPAVAEFAKGSVVYHAVSLGHYGVELFFVISGFVLALPFASQHLRGGRPVKLRQYFSRRLTRLEPPYIVAMVACGLALLATGASTIRNILPHLLASMAYVHNLAYGRSSTIDTVAWSLEIEVQFYIAAPLLCRLFQLKSPLFRRTILCVAMVASAACVAIWQDLAFTLWLIPYLHFFLAGLLLADLYVCDWDADPTPGSAWDLVSLIGWPLLFVCWYFVPWLQVVFPFAALLLFVAAFRGSLTRQLLRGRWLTTIGGMCYSIYLLHFPVIAFVTRFTLNQADATHPIRQFGIQLMALAPIVLLTSGIFYLFVEQPCMDREWPAKLYLRFISRPAEGRLEPDRVV